MHMSFHWITTKFGDYVDSIYPIELEIEDNTEAEKSASYLDLQLEIDSKGGLRSMLNAKRDEFFVHV